MPIPTFFGMVLNKCRYQRRQAIFICIESFWTNATRICTSPEVSNSLELKQSIQQWVWYHIILKSYELRLVTGGVIGDHHQHLPIQTTPDLASENFEHLHFGSKNFIYYGHTQMNDAVNLMLILDRNSK